MLAATMSVNSSYLLGWSSVIAQDIVGPLRREPLSTRAQVTLNRVANLFVSLFVMFWGLWYTLPGPAYFYLNITATIFVGGSFVAIVGGLYWKRANVAGGYAAMLGGAAGSLAFFFLNWPASRAGFGAFALAGAGLVAGSLLGRKRSDHDAVRAEIRAAFPDFGRQVVPRSRASVRRSREACTRKRASRRMRPIAAASPSTP